MKNDVPASMRHRYDLLKYTRETGMPLSEQIRISEPMEGKPDAEKEEIAAGILKDLKATAEP